MTGEYYLDEALKTTLEDLESVEFQNEDLKENVKVANECMKKLRDQIQMFKSSHQEVKTELKKVNGTIVSLKQQIKEKKKVDECLKETINQKSKECGKLEQEIMKLNSKEKVNESNALLDKLLTMQKSHKDKKGLGFS